MAAQVEGLFTTFEGSVRERLERGQSPMERLPELSPALLVAFRIDDTGKLAAPFAPPIARPILDQTFFLSSPWRDAELAEQSGGDPQEGRLSATGRSKNRKKATFFNFKFNIIDGCKIAKMFYKAFCFQYVVHLNPM